MNLHKHYFKAMGCPCEIQLYGIEGDNPNFIKKLSTELEQTVKKYEAKYSRFKKDSVLTAINSSAGTSTGISVDEDTVSILNYANQCHQISNGLFDITAGAFNQLWNFKSENPSIPSDKDLDFIKKTVGWHHVSWQPPCLKLPSGFRLDLGGIVKEYAVDVVAGICQRNGDISAAMINFGGDLRVVGDYPELSKNDNNRGWLMGITHPRKVSTAIATVSIPSGFALATSGDYERFFEMGGKRYCHIINPFTGYPASGIQGVSVVAPLCVMAGSISTIAFLMGAEKGEQWLEELGVSYLLIDGDGQLKGTMVACESSSERPKTD